MKQSCPIHVDTTFRKGETLLIGVGAVARNSNDTVLVGSSVWIPGCFIVHAVEHLTVREVTRLAARCGFRSWVIESNVIKMVRSIKMLVARGSRSFSSGRYQRSHI
ncbi:hypothetical protein TIFTF001_006991 [Ficus carica]|uniref:RNase H type-1 domain-containing protein n=1 Tax=Ficus carica TaxID=3494 RepID=A0AA87ZQJ2_FICCA|nr:hypothetical protein TIFTF001_006991 [Ficus carica]